MPQGKFMRYFYQAEKLSSARFSLMLPHIRGEAESIAGVFQELSLAFYQLNVHALGGNAQRWTIKLQEYMDTTEISDPDDEGAWVAKARTFSPDDQLEIFRIVDELAHWFDSESGAYDSFKADSYVAA
jgi:hypothetical protein